MNKFVQYRPLFVLVLVSALAGIGIANASSTGLMGWMHGFMGTALVIFAMLKLFDPVKFAEGFAKYDLIAGQSHGYGIAYPFIELGLGIAWLSHFNPYWVYIFTILLFSIGVAGVASALKRGLNTKCACMGTVLNVPLSHVTLAEDIAMIVMSVFMLVMA